MGFVPHEARELAVFFSQPAIIPTITIMSTALVTVSILGLLGLVYQRYRLQCAEERVCYLENELAECQIVSRKATETANQASDEIVRRERISQCQAELAAKLQASLQLEVTRYREAAEVLKSEQLTVANLRATLGELQANLARAKAAAVARAKYASSVRWGRNPGITPISTPIPDCEGQQLMPEVEAAAPAAPATSDSSTS